jgi:hypothetical protein
LTVGDRIRSDNAMVRASSLALLAAVVAASPAMSPAMAETMSFENAAGILAESCGKDIDANCAGVNLDAPRLKECLTRNQDSVSAQCRADYIRAFDAIQKRGAARVAVGKQCEREKQKMCAEEQEKPGAAIACLVKVSRGLGPGCIKALGDAGYR